MKLGENTRLALWLFLALVILVGFCSLGEMYLAGVGDDMLADVRAVSAEVERGDFEGAADSLTNAAEHWQSSRRVWLGLLSHQEVWTIDEALISLEVFLDEKKSEEVKNQLALLEYYLERCVEGDDLTWHNFF